MKIDLYVTTATDTTSAAAAAAVVLMMVVVVWQPEKLKPEAGVKTPDEPNVNIGMKLASTKNLTKMGSKVFAAPVCF